MGESSPAEWHGAVRPTLFCCFWKGLGPSCILYCTRPPPTPMPGTEPGPAFSRDQPRSRAKDRDTKRDSLLETPDTQDPPASLRSPSPTH